MTGHKKFRNLVPLDQVAKNMSPGKLSKLEALMRDANNATTLDDFWKAYRSFVMVGAVLHKPYILQGGECGDQRMLGVIGLAGEAGEVLDQFKKLLFHDDIRTCNYGPEYEAKIVKEMGDVLWYFVLLCDAMRKSMPQIAMQNMIKLVARAAEKEKAKKRPKGRK